MLSLAELGFTGPSGNIRYNQIQGLDANGVLDENLPVYIDIEQFIDFAIVNAFAGNADLTGNWFAARRSRNGALPYDAEPFRFFVWDADETFFGEFTLPDFFTDILPDNTTFGPKPNLLGQLLQHNEFRTTFADRLHQHLFNDGALTASAATERLARIAAEIDRAWVPETARWGDVGNPAATSPTRNEDFRDDVGQKLDFLATRTADTIGHFRDPPAPLPSLYPSTDAPEILIDGVRRHGGFVESGVSLSFELPSGFTTGDQVYYTIGGPDPREPFSENNVGVTYDAANPPSLTGNDTVWARVRKADDEWSALTKAEFKVTADPRDFLRITELMYNPPTQSIAELESAGGVVHSDQLYEYVELTNISETAHIDLSGIQLATQLDLAGNMTQGYTFDDFHPVMLDPGQRIVVAKNREAFENRYGDRILLLAQGAYTGNLSNGGDTLLLNAAGDIHRIEYSDDWYPETDSNGYSLVLSDPRADLPAQPVDPEVEEARWRASHALLGSPGEADIRLRGTVFNDTNMDGMYNSGESGVDGIEVTLTYAGPDGDISTSVDNQSMVSITDDAGDYHFSGFVAGYYQLEIESRPGLVLTAKDVGVDDSVDSDFDATFQSELFAIRDDTSDSTWDAGLILPTSPAATFDAATGTLTINGTLGDDSITVASFADLFVRLNGVIIPTILTQNVERIDVFAYAGDDTVDLKLVSPGEGYSHSSLNTNVRGGGGADQIDGTPVVDAIFGEEGPDVLNGFAGNDTLTGGIGADTLSGADGSDKYFVRGADTLIARDTVVDELIRNTNGVGDIDGDGLVDRNEIEFESNGAGFINVNFTYDTGDTLMFPSEGSVGLVTSFATAAIDALFDAAEGPYDAQWDFNNDGVVDDVNDIHVTVTATGVEDVDTDIEEFVVNILGTMFGDANLDGKVNSADLTAVGINWLEILAVDSWGLGDLNGDGVIDAQDMDQVGSSWTWSNGN